MKRPALITSLCALFICTTTVVAEPPKVSDAIRKTAAEHNLSMNMLLYPDYFITDDDFAKLAKNGFKDANMLQLVRGLKLDGYVAEVPNSADEYRKNVYPLILQYLKDVGYVAVEIPVNAATPELCKQLKTQIDKRKLRVTTVAMAGDDLEASLKHRIDSAHALGATLVVGPLVLQFKQYPEETGNARVAWVQKRLKTLVEPIRRVSDYAKKKNVRLAVEPLNRFELPGLNRLAEAIQFTKMVDHPNFGVMVDTCHEMSDGEGPEVFAKQVKTLMKMGKLWHCHISAIHRGRVDRGWFDWQGFFGTLKKAGYDGNMSMEIFDATPPFSEVVHINRRQFENPMQVALDALVHSSRKLQQVK